MRMHHSQAGYTLIQMLIVVTIIAVLASLLMSTYSQVRALAERVSCANRLRQWAMVPLGFAQDHRGLLLQTMLQGEPWLSTRDRRYEPAHVWQTTQPEPANNEVSIPIVEDYLPVIQQTGRKSAGVDIFSINSAWACPAYMRKAGRTPWTATYGGAYMNFPGYMLLTARSRSYHTSVAGQTEISDRRASANEIVMACTAFNWSSTPNTAEFYHRAASGRLFGSNRAYGDGRVQWREMSADHDKLLARLPTAQSAMTVGTRYYW